MSSNDKFELKNHTKTKVFRIKLYRYLTIPYKCFFCLDLSTEGILILG